jgi:hypothetical protein
MRRYAHQDIKHFLKHSKSTQEDRGPYTLKWFQGQDWAEIHDLCGNIVGQVSGVQLQKAGLLDLGV